ncbi:hypothetical protein MBLNU230_g4617t1 [Neophaeotheca triangularis]
MAPPQSDPEDTLDELLQNKDRIEEISDSSQSDPPPQPQKPAKSTTVRLEDPYAYYGVGVPFAPRPISRMTQDPLPPWLAVPSFDLFPLDHLETPTTEAQQKTLNECMPLLTGKDTQSLPLNSHCLPHLRRDAHIAFLKNTLGPLPEQYEVGDASRPWFFYWALSGLSLLGEDVSSYRERLMQTVRPLQNATGGFGGGHGQMSHCAATYATVLALAIVDGLEMVDRRAMWTWLGRVKQADGGFRMAIGAEEDVRGAYCALTAISLLNLPLQLPPDALAREAGLTSFLDGLGDWVGACQTFEGGIAGAPTNEAHGAYAFCALACLSILDAPHISIPKYLNITTLTHCLASLQTAPEGGFAGRTNKLVDSCYSHWVGGCWSLLQAAQPTQHQEPTPDLWNREALVRYLLTCCQQPGKKGGMRDKPSTRPDGYHTNYSLCGLSAAQNKFVFDEESWRAEDRALSAPFFWSGDGPNNATMKELKIDQEDRVAPVHPVFVLPLGAVQKARKRFAKAGAF